MIQTITVQGVQIEYILADHKKHTNPIIFVHGGAHASWAWHYYMTYFAKNGWDCYALNWFNHGASKKLHSEEFARRSLADVASEIGIVAHYLKTEPVIAAHSMGALSAQKYVESNQVAGLVLIAPCSPAAIPSPWIPIPVSLKKPWGPPPYLMAWYMFFTTLPKKLRRAYYPLLSAESSQAILEVTGRAQVSVNKTSVIKNSRSICVLAGTKDSLVPPKQARKIAAFYKADYIETEGQGHDALLIGEQWEEIASKIRDWLNTVAASKSKN